MEKQKSIYFTSREKIYYFGYFIAIIYRPHPIFYIKMRKKD